MIKLREEQQGQARRRIFDNGRVKGMTADCPCHECESVYQLQKEVPQRVEPTASDSNSNSKAAPIPIFKNQFNCRFLAQMSFVQSRDKGQLLLLLVLITSSDSLPASHNNQNGYQMRHLELQQQRVAPTTPQPKLQALTPNP